MVDDPNTIRNALVPFPARTQKTPVFPDVEALTRSQALNNYLPIQNLSQGMALYTDGETATWQPISTSTATTISGFLVGVDGLLVGAASGTDYLGGTSSLATGILKSTTGTGILTIAEADDFPTLNQNTTGSAATLAAPAIITSSAVNSVPLTIKGIASQSSNLQTWQNSSGSVVASVNSSGDIKTYYGGYVRSSVFTDYNDNGDHPYLSFSRAGVGGISLINRNSSDGAVVVKAATSQSANLQEWQNSSGTVLSNINSFGSVQIKGQSGEYPITVYTADGSTRIFSVTNGTGDVYSAGTFESATGFRVTTFGAYSGVDSGPRFIYNSTGIVALGYSNSTVLAVKAAASQTGNLQEWQDSTGYPRTVIDSTNILRLNHQSSTSEYSRLYHSSGSCFIDCGSNAFTVIASNSYKNGRIVPEQC